MQSVYENPEFNHLFSRELGKMIMDLQTTGESHLPEVIQVFTQEMESRVLPFLRNSSSAEIETIVNQSELIDQELKNHEKELENLSAEVKSFQKASDQLKKTAMSLQKKSKALIGAE